MKMEVMNVSVSGVELGKNNPRELNKEELKNSDLFKSIKANGVQHPIEVRDVFGKKYVLLSGERRLMIAKELKLKTIPAVVYSDMTDQQAYDKTHFENQARENLSPMEAAKDALTMLELHQGDAEAVAAKLSLSPRELRLRLKLKDLTPKWQEELGSEDVIAGHKLNELSIAHLELIARLDPERQQEMLDSANEWIAGLDYSDDGLITVPELRDYIETKYSCLLGDAQWDLDLHDVAEGSDSPCSQCDKRTDRQDQLGLWGESDTPADVRCLDVECFTRKLWGNLRKMVDALRVKHPELILIGDRHLPEEFGKCVSKYDVKKCKKSDPSAKPAVTIENNHMSAVQWVKKQARGGSDDGSNLDKSEGPKSLKVRREELHGRRLKMVYDALKNAIEERELPIAPYDRPTYLAALVCAFGGDGRAYADDDEGTLKFCGDLADGMPVKAFIDFEETSKKMTLCELLWRKVKGNLKQSISCDRAVIALELEPQAVQLAKLIDFPFDASLESAIRETPEPKSWAGLNEDGTPKAKG